MENSFSNHFFLDQETIEEYTSLLMSQRYRTHVLRPFQRRHSTFSNSDNNEGIDSDSLCESVYSSSFDSKSNNSNEDLIAFDYKSYPITLDWLLIDNDEHYYDIFSSRGAMGIILLNCLSKNYKPNKTDENLLSQIVNTYIMRLNSSKEHINELISKLPKFIDFKTILLNRYYTKKEIILLKIIIDFQCCYLKLNDNPLYQNLNNWLLTAQAFYSQLSKEDIQLIFNEIVIPSCQLKKKISKLVNYLIII